MKEQEEHKTKFINMSNQNKIIVLGWFVSSLLIFATALLVIGNTQKKIFQSYYDFGLMLAKTLSIESADLTSNLTDPQKIGKLENHSARMLGTNKDIAYVIFKDNKDNIIYTTPSKLDKKHPQIIEISTPIISNIKGKETIIGSVQLGLTGNSMKEVGKTTRNSMIIIFTVVWIISMFAVLINTLLITRQITLLVDGVRKISSGEFGYKIIAKDLWGEIKQLFDAFNDMSVRLSQYEDKNIDQLTYERNKLEAVLMSIANGVVVCDNFDNVILINNSALSMMNVKSKQILNTKIQSFCDSNGHICLEEHIEKFKDTPLEDIEKTPLEFQVDIDHRLFKAFVSPIFTLNQDYLGYIMILHDVTREVEIDKMKSNFISNVSHELRTPVTVLRSYIETLHNYNDEFDDKTKGEFLSIMNQEADRLNRMVNDILDFSRLESPNIRLEKEYSDIKPIMELTVNSMSVLAEEKNIAFSIIIEPDLPRVYINTDSIERVLKNLLSNAIKYSNNNGKIKARAELDRSGKFVEVTIEDNGIGIPEIHMEKIFDRFYRVETQSHAIKGTGLGLHLVKIAIEKHHNGEVFVSSEPGVGSKFGFRLPLDVEIEEKVEPTEERPHFESVISSQNVIKSDDDWEISIEKA